MNIIIRILFAAMIGALAGISIAKSTSDNPVVLTISALFGGLVGFILVGPKDFAIAFMAEWQKFVEKWRRAMQKREEKKRIQEELKARDPIFRPLYILSRKLDGVFCLFFTSLVFWLLGGLSLILHIVDPSDPLWLLPAVLGLILSLLIGVLPLFEDVRMEFAKLKEEKLEEEIRRLQSKMQEDLELMRTMILGPFWILWQMLRGIWWCVCHIGFLARCFTIVLARTCRFVASMERWCAAIGAVAGFIVGWANGKSEAIAMLVGGGVGAGIYLAARALLKILPDPDSDWPEPAKAKA